MKHVDVVVGARPQFVKLAPLVEACPPEIELTIIHTGQHYDQLMSEVFFSELGIPAPAVNLSVGSGTHGRQTARILELYEAHLLDGRPDLVIVFGDTNSTLAAALAASKLNIPIAHVEAGLRSFARMPEEINRVLTDHLSQVLFAPTPLAVDNLAREGITEQVHLVGDIMVDSVNLGLERSKAMGPGQFNDLIGDFALLTLHRESTIDSIEVLGGVIGALVSSRESYIFPCHPRTRAALARYGLLELLVEPRFRLIDPVGYLDMLALLGKSRFVVTDSGGLQKEAFLARKPCVTLRDETEWTETVACGWNQVAGVEPAIILKAIENVTVPLVHPRLYGDGDSAQRILETVSAYLGR